MVGVVGSSPIAPTKFGRRIKGLAVSPSPLFLAVRKSAKKLGADMCLDGVERSDRIARPGASQCAGLSYGPQPGQQPSIVPLGTPTLVTPLTSWR